MASFSNKRKWSRLVLKTVYPWIQTNSSCWYHDHSLTTHLRPIYARWLVKPLKGVICTSFLHISQVIVQNMSCHCKLKTRQCAGNQVMWFWISIRVLPGAALYFKLNLWYFLECILFNEFTNRPIEEYDCTHVSKSGAPLVGYDTKIADQQPVDKKFHCKICQEILSAGILWAQILWGMFYLQIEKLT